MMGAGFERDVGSRTAHGFASLFERDDLGVVTGSVAVRTFGDNTAVTDKDTAYLRVRAGKGGCLLCQCERTLHEPLVFVFNSFSDG